MKKHGGTDAIVLENDGSENTRVHDNNNMVTKADGI